MKIKLHLLTLLMLCSFLKMNAQSNYTFTHSTQSYSALVSPTVVVNNSGFIGSVYNINIGFNFHYFGSAYSSISFSTDGYCYIGTVSSYGFYTMYTNLKGLGNSQISYVLDASGGSGNKILKLEWKHVGFLNDATNSDSASFQIWLYETTDKVEYHFGQWHINPNDFMSLFSNTFGLFEAFVNPAGTSYYNLQGDPSNPSFVHNPTSNLYLTGYPSSGTVYTFSNGISNGISENNSSNQIKTFPQPSFENLFIENKNTEKLNSFSIMNLSGEIIETGIFKNTPLEIISLSQLSSGIYFLKVNYSSGSSSIQKFIHQR